MDDREKYSNDYMHMDRESLAEKSLSQAFSASNVGVRILIPWRLY